MKLFISYSRDDRQYVYELANLLRDESGHLVWIDKAQLVGGDAWWEGILSGIDDSECFIPVLTPRSLASIYCAAELRYAAAMNKAILPLKLKPFPDDDIPAEIRHIQIENIAEISLDRALARCERAFGRIQMRLVQGMHPLPAPLPPRPSVPVLRPTRSHNELFEVYAAAVEAAPRDPTLASQLFQQVVAAWPDSTLARAALMRQKELQQVAEREAAYRSIVKMAATHANQRSAKEAWRAYVERYGLIYDPERLASQLGERPGPTIYVHKNPEPPPATRREQMGIPQVYVPVGKFLMGSTPEQVEAIFAEAQRQYRNAEQAWFTPEMPQREIRLTHGFWMDMFPVTNDMYVSFMADDGYKREDLWSPEGWRWRVEERITRPENYDGFTDPQQPRVGVSWYEAEAYCHWRGGRLPTEAEWEYAARGVKGWRYPWGDVYLAGYANTDESIVGGPYLRKTTPVGHYEPGKSWCGVYDLAGNVWEWCADWYDEHYYRVGTITDPVGPAHGEFRVLRGGSWYGSPLYARTSYRYWGFPSYRNLSWGFRVIVNSTSAR